MDLQPIFKCHSVWILQLWIHDYDIHCQRQRWRRRLVLISPYTLVDRKREVLLYVHWAPLTVISHYRPQRSCGKVMFLHLSVILSTGVGCLVDTPYTDTPLQADTSPPGQTSSLAGRHPPRDGHRSRHLLAGSHPPPPRRDGHCSGRYAFYSNAFLLQDNFFNTAVNDFDQEICSLYPNPLQAVPHVKCSLSNSPSFSVNCP